MNAHGYTCGHCSWGRDAVRSRGEYEAHKAATGHVGEPAPAPDDAAALAAALDALDVIDGIVDDTHPEGDGCPLCRALDELRDALAALPAHPPAPPEPESRWVATARTEDEDGAHVHHRVIVVTGPQGEACPRCREEAENRDALLAFAAVHHPEPVCLRCGEPWAMHDARDEACRDGQGLWNVGMAAPPAPLPLDEDPERLARAILAARSTTARWKGSARATEPTRWDRLMAKRVLLSLATPEPTEDGQP